MIICVTPNAALDRTLLVPDFATEGVFRSTQTIVDAGGKGINVARAIRVLGGEALCSGFLGGHTGQRIAKLLQADGIRAQWIHIASGESRTCIILVDPEQATSAVINEPGPILGEADWDRLRQTLLDNARAGAAVCFCGSLPQSSPLEKFKEVLAALVDAGCTVWVDTSGEALAAAASLSGISLKINVAEAAALLKRQIATWQDAAEAAERLHRQLSAPVVLTRGREGAVMICASRRWIATPPPIEMASTVGSGDSFLAGLLVALERGAQAPEALCHAVAAGAANAQSVGGARFALEDFNQLLAQTTIRQLS